MKFSPDTSIQTGFGSELGLVLRTKPSRSNDTVFSRSRGKS